MSTPTATPLAPLTLRQGDTWSWTRTYADYPAPAWSVTARLVNASAAAAQASTPSGTDHLIKFAAAATAAITPGTYALIETVTDGTDRYTVGQGELLVLPDPASATPYDPRGPMRKAYDAARAALADYATNNMWTVLELRIQDRLSKYHTPEELRRHLGWLRREAEIEDARAAGTKRTYQPGTTFGVSFGAQS